jgi:hypothetical protein
MTILSLDRHLIGFFEKFSSFFKWWRYNLISAIPQVVLARSRTYRTFEVCEGGFFATAVLSGKQKSSCLMSPSSLTQKNVRAFLRSRSPAIFIPPDDRILSREITVPAGIFEQFGRYASIEVERWTPFNSDEVYLGWQKVGGADAERVILELLVLPKQHIETPLRQLAALGVVPSSVLLREKPNVYAALDVRSGAGKFERTIRACGIILLIAACTVLVVEDRIDLLANVAAQERSNSTLIKQYARQREAEGRLTELMALLTEGAAAQAQRKGSFLAGLTRSLPKDAWLTDIQFHEGAVTVRGYARSPTDLMSSLEPIAEKGGGWHWFRAVNRMREPIKHDLSSR